MKRVVEAVALVVLLFAAGCGESTEIALAKVAPVTPTNQSQRRMVRRGIVASPDVLPGQSN